MRIRKIHAEGIEPIKKFEIDGLSDLIVIAGPNGVGKTRLVNALLNYFQNFSAPNVNFIIESTHADEVSAWNKKILDTSNQEDAKLLRTTLQRNRRRRNFHSSVFYAAYSILKAIEAFKI